MKIIRFLQVLLLFAVTSAFAGEKYQNHFIWEKIENLPQTSTNTPQLGVSGAFAGTSNGCVIVAGGCNFPDTPVVDGGKKKYYQDIYVLSPSTQKWSVADKLPVEIAYGASITTPQGIVMVGGNNNQQTFKTATLLQWNAKSQKIEIKQLPALPAGMTNCAGTYHDSYVYVAGGDSKDKSNHFFRLNINKPTAWEKLPSFPGQERIQPALVAQNGAESTNIFLFGGSSISDKSQEPVVSKNGLVYNTKTNQWSEIAPISSDNKQYALHGACGVASGKNHILFFGGVDYNTFQEALLREYKGYHAQTEQEKTDFNNWKREYLTKPANWYKFSDRVLVYNTIIDKWSVGEKYPYQPVAGAVVAPYEDGWYIINGEIKPGVRTSDVTYAKLADQSSFGWINWSVLILYLGSMLLLGFYFMGKTDNTEDFFKGGGRIPWWAAGISIFATMLSAITFMAIPAKSYATNWTYFPLAITILIVAIPVVKYFLPFFTRLNVTTAYEYLEKRFNYNVRILASSLFIIFMIARLALALYLTSLALTTVTGIDITVCIVMMGVVTLIYCTMGGTEAVVWSDVIQGIILIGGALLAIVFLVVNIPGGFPELIQISVDHHKFKMFDTAFDLTSPTIWVMVLGGLANNLISYTSDQSVIQRYITTTSEKAAGRSIIMNGFLSLIASVIFYFIGTALFAFYQSHPNTLNFNLQNTDTIFPHFIMAELPVGLAGLLISAIFAATMSTVSSNINSLATAFTVDIYQHFLPKTEDTKLVTVARYSGIILGTIGILLAIGMASSNILSLLDLFNYLLGLLTSSVAALFIIGIFIPRVGYQSVLGGFVLGNIVLLCISIYTPISFLLYGFIGILFTVCFSYLLSFIMPNKKDITGVTWKTIRRIEE